MIQKPLTALLLAALCGCATFPDDRIPRCAARAPLVATGHNAGEGTARLSVLTYNVEGLPWPARRKRAARLREIGLQLAEMRTAGTAPDVVLLQEVFSREAALIGERSGYTNRVRGPDRRAPRPKALSVADRESGGRRKLLKGEGLGRVFGSGLFLLTDFMVTHSIGRPFRKGECAGFDCLANKGLQHVHIRVPGVPRTVELFNTHLNSRGAARVSEPRSRTAHQLQVDEVSRFLAEHRDPANPLVFGGDFNMRQSEERFAHFEATFPYELVHRHCLAHAGSCEVTLSWDGDSPWLDTQDLQGFDDGVIKVRPVRVSAMFDAPWRGRPLSDHDGLLVEYHLSWPLGLPDDEPVPLCG